MRHAYTLVTLLAALAFATVAHAGGVSLRWNGCDLDLGVQNKTFTCGTNAGSETLVGSFTLGADLSQVSGNEVVIDLATAGAVLPQWWQFRNPGTCRENAMTAIFGSASVLCPDWASGHTVVGISSYVIGSRGPNTARVTIASEAPPQDLTGGQEYFSFKLAIDNSKTVGAGACAGCTTPACIFLSSVTVDTPVPANNVKLTGPANGFDSDFALWQGGGGVVVGGVTNCPAATPTQQRTWGAVKALYR